VQGMPTSVRIRAFAKGTQATIVVPISQKTPNLYHSPLQGVWYMRGAQDITSHHRWNANTEFAVDFFKYGENGLPWRTDGRSAADFYAFGLPVLAAADGVVVAAENTATQNYDVRLQHPGESDEAYDARLTAYNLAMMKTDPYKALIGNYVVIQHGDEYSSYKHLKTGSVLVKPGDHVTTGQQIASVGDTGDSNFVHLHFQISEGVDPLTARSIPFTFINLRPAGGDLGRIVRISE
jgi:murein DD-endopeptidase MepM/ murein hydrolase activator NlpD